MNIGELLARDLSRPIEEVIKVDQFDEETVFTEITEYVATDRIRDQYRMLLKEIAEAPSDPSEGVGVWISGFFGSGKSSFAKNLGYVLADRIVLDQRAAELFSGQIGDRRVAELVDFINARIPTDVMMFDISKASEVRKGDEKIAEVVYRALLSKFDYALDFDLAELEIELESEDRLEEFNRLCPLVSGGLEWRKACKGAKKLNVASAVLHRMDPGIFPQPDSWAHSLREKSTVITAETVVERAFQFAERRGGKKALVIIIDEVGQYVARSGDKIEDLRALVEQFGKVGKNYVKAKKASAPIWIMVTSQEKLDEVVAAIDDKRVELARLRDRFKFGVDMAPADIREVATRRVLAKRPEAEDVLGRLFQGVQGQINLTLRWERTSRKTEISEADFIQFYPYPPHFTELSIDIMSGIRLQPGAPKHYGGSNRTIIKQIYEMLVNERTDFASKPVGTLVTLDQIFELVEGNLSNEKQKDISDIAVRFKDDPDDPAMSSRVAKVVCLLEFVRDLPRTDGNIAACMVGEAGRPAPLAEVRRALKKLEDAQFVRNTEEGWKLQTAQEKNWETERRAVSIKPKDRNDIQREALKTVFSDPRLKTYRHRDLKSFRIGLSVNDGLVDDGDIPLALHIAEDADGFPGKLGDIRNESRQESRKNTVFWVLALTPEIDALVAGLHASRQMIAKYTLVGSQGRISTEESACLQNERNEETRLSARLRDKLTEAVEQGQGLFRGVSRDAVALGKTVGDMFKRLFDWVVPDLYPKLEMAARQLKGSEASDVLKAANLNALPVVFYGGDAGLNLVVKENNSYVPNPNADVAREVLDYLNAQHGYGHKDTRTGKGLETHFGGIGYGWERDVLRVILAVLFRAGAIDVSHGGKRHDSHRDALARVPFENHTAFKSAVFTPAKQIDLKTLRAAVENYEELCGGTVEMEKNAIAAALRKFADEELKPVFRLIADMRAENLPGLSQVEMYRDDLNAILDETSEGCVQKLVGEGASLREETERVRRLRETVTPAVLDHLRVARKILAVHAPLAVSERPELAEVADRLRGNLGSEAFHDRVEDVRADARTLFDAHVRRYAELHERRGDAYRSAIDDVKGRVEWLDVPPEQHESVVRELIRRACGHDVALPEAWRAGDDVCSECRAGLAQMESDLAALDGLRTRALARVRELTAPSGTVERVRLSNLFSGVLESEASVEDALQRLREHLLKLIAEGKKIVVE